MSAAELRLSHVRYLLHKQRSMPVFPQRSTADRRKAASCVSQRADAINGLQAVRQTVPGRRETDVLFAALCRRSPAQADRRTGTEIPGEKPTADVTLLPSESLTAQGFSGGISAPAGCLSLMFAFSRINGYTKPEPTTLYKNFMNFSTGDAYGKQ